MATSEFRFFVDAATLSVSDDGIVRYVLVARSPGGVDNVSLEGMRCATSEVRIYALGRDGAWVGRPTDCCARADIRSPRGRAKTRDTPAGARAARGCPDG